MGGGKTRTGIQIIDNTLDPTGAQREVEDQVTERVAQNEIKYELDEILGGKKREFEGTIAGIVDQRKRAPGRSQTLLGNLSQPSGTLLTKVGG